MTTSQQIHSAIAALQALIASIPQDCSPSILVQSPAPLEGSAVSAGHDSLLVRRESGAVSVKGAGKPSVERRTISAGVTKGRKTNKAEASMLERIFLDLKIVR